jgi:hypothetical protein
MTEEMNPYFYIKNELKELIGKPVTFLRSNIHSKTMLVGILNINKFKSEYNDIYTCFNDFKSVLFSIKDVDYIDGSTIVFKSMISEHFHYLDLKS